MCRLSMVERSVATCAAELNSTLEAPNGSPPEAPEEEEEEEEGGEGEGKGENIVTSKKEAALGYLHKVVKIIHQAKKVAASGAKKFMKLKKQIETHS